MNWRSPEIGRLVQNQTRPQGEVIWVHVNSQERYLVLSDLGIRLRQNRPDLFLLISYDHEDMSAPPSKDMQKERNEIHMETPENLKDFLETWQPDLCIWAGGAPQRSIIRNLKDFDTPALLVDMTTDEFPARNSRWLPDQRIRALNGFERVMTSSDVVQERLLRSGLEAEKISLTGALRVSTCPPPCSEEDLAHMQKQLGGRPVWLTTHTRLEELTSILNAHRKALKLLHRLLLIVSLDNWADLEAARAIIRGCSLDMADWDIGEDPEELTQVLLCDGDDLGLWYRLSPVCLMAGSLERRFTGHNPLDAAALGSAVLYGKGHRDHANLYAQLEAAGAAIKVRSMGQLADEVLRLSAPDKAAAMALAGWKVVTEGSEATDHLLEITQDLLDLQEARHETA
ncbi:3-deoxy-D-manno-octulosonic acid transferase [Epibacterium ulvae]|uniref:3-deoxy-D-manno-octulosonic acid transferase n=1 Tax=Epibacterium ulvae TaxID=1156985 RepID=UPI002492D1D2|nr:glycosyltransferase N-terminal domain-containing protein [Epibacterium ulvae]